MFFRCRPCFLVCLPHPLTHQNMYGVFTLCRALGAAYSVYSIKRQFNFANVSGMLSCHKLMVICAQLQSFRLTYLYLTSEAALLRPLLLTGTASAFTYFIFRQKLHSILTRAGLDESNIKGHSFRGGGATWLSTLEFQWNRVK